MTAKVFERLASTETRGEGESTPTPTKDEGMGLLAVPKDVGFDDEAQKTLDK